MSGRTILITSVGVIPADVTDRHPVYTYAFDDGEHASAWSAVALTARLRATRPEDTPDVIRVISTPEALDQHLLAMRDALPGTPIEAWPTTGERDDLFRQCAAAVFDAERIVLDLTQGPRHIALFTLAFTLLWRTLEGRAVLDAVYTPLLGAPPDRRYPVTSLLPMLRLDALTQSARQFIDTGSPRALLSLLDHTPDSMQVRKRMEALSLARENGLPVESALAAAELAQYARPVRTAFRAADAPEVDRVTQRVLASIDDERHPDIRPGIQKKATAFDATEDRRQRRMIEAMIARQQWGNALSLAREWAVSRTLPPGVSWLDGKVREKAERHLGRLRTLANDPIRREALPSPLRGLGDAWREVSDARNDFAHMGMSGKNVLKGRYREALWRDLERAIDDLDPACTIPDRPKLLIAPIGMSPGALYTAWRNTDADHLLVIGSAQSLTKVDAAIDAAAAVGRPPPGHINRLCVADPIAGYDAAREALNPSAIRDALGAAMSVDACLTGGTTLLGWMAGTLATHAERAGCTVARFAVSDPRTIEAQRADPWTDGARHPLD